MWHPVGPDNFLKTKIEGSSIARIKSHARENMDPNRLASILLSLNDFYWEPNEGHIVSQWTEGEPYGFNSLFDISVIPGIKEKSILRLGVNSKHLLTEDWQGISGVVKLLIPNPTMSIDRTTTRLSNYEDVLILNTLAKLGDTLQEYTGNLLTRTDVRNNPDLMRNI